MWLSKSAARCSAPLRNKPADILHPTARSLPSILFRTSTSLPEPSADPNIQSRFWRARSGFRRTEMPQSVRKITEHDILSDADYAGRRKDLRTRAILRKKKRRLEVGPFATFHFENYETMWLQVQEML